MENIMISINDDDQLLKLYEIKRHLAKLWYNISDYRRTQENNDEFKKLFGEQADDRYSIALSIERQNIDYSLRLVNRDLQELGWEEIKLDYENND